MSAWNRFFRPAAGLIRMLLSVPEHDCGRWIILHFALPIRVVRDQEFGDKTGEVGRMGFFRPFLGDDVEPIVD